MTCSDDWNFPTNKFPTVGWLGRVHRGTPWQTVYLKSSDVISDIAGNAYVGTNLWVNWTSDENPYDAVNSAPKKDWVLFDLFSSTIDDDATRGQLSVNVGANNPDPLASLAAWLALFSGVMVVSNDAPDSVVAAGQAASTLTNYTAYPISPAGPPAPIHRWASSWRAFTTSAPILRIRTGPKGYSSIRDTCCRCRN